MLLPYYMLYARHYRRGYFPGVILSLHLLLLIMRGNVNLDIHAYVAYAHACRGICTRGQFNTSSCQSTVMLTLSFLHMVLMRR